MEKEKIKLFRHLSLDNQLKSILNGDYEIHQKKTGVQIFLKKQVVAEVKIEDVNEITSVMLWKHLMTSFEEYLWKQKQEKMNRQKYSLVSVLEMLSSNPGTYYAIDTEGEIELSSRENFDDSSLTTIYSRTKIELPGTTFALKKLMTLFTRKTMWKKEVFVVVPIAEAKYNKELPISSLIGDLPRDTHKNHTVKDIYERLP